MRISMLIDQLTKLREKHGDAVVRVNHDGLEDEAGVIYTITEDGKIVVIIRSGEEE